MEQPGLQNLRKTVQNESSSNGFKVTGQAIQYATVCMRELWLYLHGVNINKDNPHIATGTVVDNSYYTDSDTIIIDSMIAPDIMENGSIIEVKPSSGFGSGPEMQLSYYLWYLNEFYQDTRTGVLAYPTERKREIIQLTENRTRKVEKLIEDVYQMYIATTPPSFEEKDFCDSCAYKDVCQI